MLRRLAADLGLWYFAPSVFMALYVLKFAQPAAAITPHLLVATLPLLALASSRLLLARFIAHQGLRTWCAAIIAAGLHAGLLLYYLLVIIGLHSWGGVVAWNVIPTFLAQSSVLADALGLSEPLLAAILALAYLSLLMSWLLYFKHFDWADTVYLRLSAATLWMLLAGMTAVVAVELFQLVSGVWIHASEPVSLTLYPSSADGLDLEGVRINPAAASAASRREDAARAAYTPSQAAPAALKNLVVIVVDALRPDHMQLYGYDRPTTPNLARIATQHPVRIVEDVHSTCGDTACAMFSLFSSGFPADFSLRPFFLHDVLRRNRYRMHLILSGDHSVFYGLKRFYGPVDTFYDGTQSTGYYLNDDQLVVQRLAAMPDWDGVPVMFQFHLMSAHILRKREDHPGPFEPAARYAFSDSRDAGAAGEPLQSAVNFYDNGVVRADAVINDLLNSLQTKGYLHDTLVVITADHGESLGEHGLFHHANSVREELLRIPLLLISYGYSGQPLAQSQIFPSQVDVAPTIAAELALARPDTWAGQPLQDAAGPASAITYFVEHSDVGLIDRRDPRQVWKYWRNPISNAEHAFDLSTDEHENREQIAKIPAARLSEWRAHVAPQIQAILPAP